MQDMRKSTVRLFFYAALLLLGLRIIWNLFGSDNVSSLQDMDNIILNHRDPNVRGFKPSHCIVIDGKCIPQHEANLQDSFRGLITRNGKFYLDSQPITILGGSFHYFRTHPGHWGDRLLKMKAAGLNTVTTYVPWNLHEQVKGQYNFTGLFDLPSFLQVVHRVGLKAIVRPGPYICAEWDWGGLPSWLLNDPNMVVRTSQYPPYLKFVKEYFNQLLPILAKHQYKRRQGPIIAFQIENEFGSYGKDPEYLEFIKEEFKAHGLDELLLTSDGPDQLTKGRLQGVLGTVNFKNNVEGRLQKTRMLQPDQPILVMEYWAGWFDYWGYEHNAESPDDFAKRVQYILKYNASINFYMFEGGTSFGFWNGANWVTEKPDHYQPQVTSYDYDAPLSEAGDITPKYHKVRDMIINMKLNGPQDIPDVPQDTPKATYGKYYAEYAMSYKDMIVMLPIQHLLYYSDPKFMEYLDINNGGGQGYGFILYRHSQVPGEAKELKIDGVVADRMQMIVNGLEERTLELNDDDRTFVLRGATQSKNVIDLLVENTGRINFKKLNDQRKGIQGSISVDGKRVTNWLHAPFEFTPQFISNLMKDDLYWKNAADVRAPAVYRTTFELVGAPTDTFLDMSSWTKGIVIINHFNLGRYWNIGPVKTLFVPSPVLKPGTNEVLVFELHQPGHEITFTDKPILLS